MFRLSFFLAAFTLFSPVLPAQDKPLAPREAVKKITVPDGFRARLYAGEPDVLNPIAMNLDDRGRLWVVESHSYPHWIKDGKPGKDRILIFEGQKEDGSFAKSTVFLEHGTNLSGILLGHGGVWLCSTPNLLFIPIKAGEDKPAGPAEVVLDGFAVDIQHNVVNNLHWGPDGWLYGCHGITKTSNIGRPGTEKARVPFNCGVWRYHPIKKVVEPYAWGTTNPWGLDWDDYGEMFITNCVIKHAFHVIPGAHFVRMYGEDLDPFVFGLIESCADHTHWGGGHWTSSRGGAGAHDEAGGGHAHAGAMVYLADTWPKEYRGQLFMGNLHGARINMDRLERKGSGYVSKRGFDPFKANDPWFRPLTVLQAPDGNVYVSDWHDTGECHNYDKTYPSGRIYRWEYGKGRPEEKIDIAALDDLELVKLQLHENDWFVRRARLQLQERAAAGNLNPMVRLKLEVILEGKEDVTRKLRALWALYVVERGIDLWHLLQNEEPEVRVWAVRLAAQEKSLGGRNLKGLIRMAEKDPSPAVRLALASALQRLPLEDRWGIAEKLVLHEKDWNDPNIPFMLWYGIEPLAAADPERAVRLLEECKLPIVRLHLSRRLALRGDKRRAIDCLLERVGKLEAPVQRDILRGIYEAFRGQRKVPMPGGWKEIQGQLWASRDEEVREKSLFLSVIFGDAEALTLLQGTTRDGKEGAEKRRKALQTLVEAKADGLLPLLEDLLTEKEMRTAALRALAGQADAAVPGLVLKHYAKYETADKEAAVATLSTRPEFALALLDAVEKKTVPRGDISALAARQHLGLNDKKVTARLNEVWGTLRPTAGAKRELLTKYLSVAAPEALKKADRGKGHQLFTKHCATCHKLFGEGGAIGPELTGSQRTNPEYLLTKVLDPSAMVNQDYQVTVLFLEDGRTLQGIVKEETDKTLALQTPLELVRLSKADIQTRKKTGLSMMPEGLLQTLTEPEIRDLIAYLGGAGPIK